MPDNDNNVGNDTNIDTVRDKPNTTQNTKPVVQSPANDPTAPLAEQINADNDASREADQETLSEQDPVQRAVSGANAGIDNDPSNRPPRVRGKGRKPTGFNEDVQAQDPDATTGAPQKLDSFGRPGDTPQPRPQMTPDLAEPLHNPAGRGPQGTADAGDTTARLHASMRATGAKQYGLIGTDEEAEAGSSSTSGSASGSGAAASTSSGAGSASVGTVTDPHHALSLVRGKVSQLHQMMNNVGNVASVPVHAMEDLMADIKYLFGVLRSKV